MKAHLKGITVLALVSCVSNLSAQGTISFSNFAVEITRMNTLGGASLPAGAPGLNLVVSLFLANDINTPLATTDFITGTGFINPLDEDVIVPGHPVNSTDAVFIVYAYQPGKTWLVKGDNWTGQSEQFRAGPLGGPNGSNPPVIPPDLANMQTFLVTPFIPEPTTIALGAVGFATLLFRRRK